MCAAASPANDLRTAAARLLVVCAVLLALTGMGWVFWKEEVQYSLPTPRPDGLVQVPRGDVQPLPASLTDRVAIATDRPVLLHFYNPECPCSRFNRDHVQGLRTHFGARVQFVEVVEQTAADARPSSDDTDWVVDADGSIARACGIYSTPQAMLLDPQRRVAYRGNFNTSRWCGEPETQFVRIAIEQLLSGSKGPVDPLAEHAYGCPLPQEERRARER